MACSPQENKNAGMMPVQTLGEITAPPVQICQKTGRNWSMPDQPSTEQE
jgi:hypothetical protein